MVPPPEFPQLNQPAASAARFHFEEDDDLIVHFFEWLTESHTLDNFCGFPEFFPYTHSYYLIIKPYRKSFRLQILSKSGERISRQVWEDFKFPDLLRLLHRRFEKLLFLDQDQRERQLSIWRGENSGTTVYYIDPKSSAKRAKRLRRKLAKQSWEFVPSRVVPSLRQYERDIHLSSRTSEPLDEAYGAFLLAQAVMTTDFQPMRDDDIWESQIQMVFDSYCYPSKSALQRLIENGCDSESDISDDDSEFSFEFHPHSHFSRVSTLIQHFQDQIDLHPKTVVDIHFGFPFAIAEALLRSQVNHHRLHWVREERNQFDSRTIICMAKGYKGHDLVAHTTVASLPQMLASPDREVQFHASIIAFGLMDDFRATRYQTHALPDADDVFEELGDLEVAPFWIDYSTDEEEVELVPHSDQQWHDSIFDDPNWIDRESDEDHEIPLTTYTRAMRYTNVARDIVIAKMVNTVRWKLEASWMLFMSYRSAMWLYWQTGQRRHIRYNDLKRAVMNWCALFFGGRSYGDFLVWALDTLIELPSMFFPQSSDWNFPGNFNNVALVVTALPFLFSFPSKRLERLSNFINNYSRRGGGKDQTDLLNHFVESTAWLYDTGLQCFEAKSFSPFFHTPATYGAWHAEVCQHLETRTIAELTSETYPDYLSRLTTLQDQGIQIRNRAEGKDRWVFSFADRKLNAIADVLNSEQLANLARTSKAPPFAIGLFGPPCTGKTTFIDELLKVYSCIAGKEFKPHQKYVNSASDKFESGLRNSHRYFVLDDLGAINPDRAGEAAGAAILRFMEFFNSMSSASNQADVSDKGKIFALPEVVVATTNDEAYGTHKVAKEPWAFFRRLRYEVVLVVKEEFTEDDGIRLDVTKIGKETDLHYFTVHEFQESTATNGLPRRDVIMEKASQVEFFRWYRNVISAHLSHRKNFSDQLGAIIKQKFCDGCSMLEMRCQCVKPQGSCLSSTKKVALSVRQRLQEFAASLLEYGSLFRHFREFLRNDYEFYSQLKRIIASFIAMVMVRGIDKLDDEEIKALKSTRPNAVEDKKKKMRQFKAVTNKKEQFSKELVAQSEQYDSFLQRLKLSDLEVEADPWRSVETPPEFELRPQTQSISIETLYSKVKKNIVWLEFFDVDGSIVRGSEALGLYGSFVLTTAHNVTKEIAFIRLGGTKKMLDVRSAILSINLPNDFVMIRIEGRLFRSLLAFLPVEINSLPHAISVLSTSSRFPDHDGIWATATPASVFDNGNTYFKFLVNKQGVAGLCGSVYLASMGNRVFILGMHQYGAGADSLCLPLTSHIGVDSAAWARSLLKERLTNRLSDNGLRLTHNRPVSSTFHRKSYVHFRTGPWPDHFKPLCEIPYGISKPKTHFRPTPLVEHPLSRIPACGKVVPDMRVGETENGYQNPFNDGIDQYIDFQSNLQEQEVMDAAFVVAKRFVSIFEKLDQGCPLEERESLNGVHGVRFLDALKRKTGQGLPKRGPKSEFIAEDVAGRSYTPEARQAFQSMVEALAEGVNPGIIGDATLKDEPKKPKKAVRVFTQYPFLYNDLMRRLVLPLLKVIQENPILFGISIGMNAESRDWKDIFDKHIDFPFHVLFDFSKFDKSHNKFTMKAVALILYACAQVFYPKSWAVHGFPWQLLFIRGMNVTIFPLLNFLNTIFECEGGLGSGLFFTAIANSIAQAIILQILWHRLQKRRGEERDCDSGVDTFAQKNVDDKYGDDGMLSTTDPEFNLAYFISEAATFGLKITDPNKGTEIPDSFPVEKWEYLKRRFVKYGDRVWAPLAIDSILKQLNFWTGDDDKSEYSAMCERCEDAVKYFSYHDDATYYRYVSIIQHAMDLRYGVRPLGEHFPLRAEIHRKYDKYFQPTGYSNLNLATKMGMSRVYFRKLYFSRATYPELDLKQKRMFWLQSHLSKRANFTSSLFARGSGQKQ